jgi:ribosomal protein S18 acetylase RimI-like enzyme
MQLACTNETPQDASYSETARNDIFRKPPFPSGIIALLVDYSGLRGTIVNSHWRQALPSDLPAIAAIAAKIHPDLPERSEVFAEKQRLYPDGCRVLVAGDAVGGYGIAHPWKLHRIPPLDDFLRELPGDADCLYVHDVVVLPDFRGKRVAGSYIADVAALARAADINSLALVSVYGTQSLWERFGFRAVATDAALRGKLASYGENAIYMVKGGDHNAAADLQNFRLFRDRPR